MSSSKSRYRRNLWLRAGVKDWVYINKDNNAHVICIAQKGDYYSKAYHFMDRNKRIQIDRWEWFEGQVILPSTLQKGQVQSTMKTGDVIRCHTSGYIRSYKLET